MKRLFMVVSILATALFFLPATVFAESITVVFNDGFSTFTTDSIVESGKLYISVDALSKINGLDPSNNYKYKGRTLDLSTNGITKDGKEYIWARAIKELFAGDVFFDSYYRKLYINDFPKLALKSFYLGKELFDMNGKPVIVPGIASSASYLGEGMFSGKDENGSIVICTMSGGEVRDFGVSNDDHIIKIGEFSNGLAYYRVSRYSWITTSEGGYGKDDASVNCFIRTDGSVAFEVPLDVISLGFGRGYAALFKMGGKDTKYRIIDTKGNYVGDREYDNFSPLGEGVVLVNTGNDKQGIFLPDGSFTDLSMYTNDILECRDGLIHVCKKGKYGFIDIRGNVVIPIIYDNIQYGFGEGVVGVQKGKQHYFIDRNNKKVLDIKAPYAIEFGLGYTGFSEGLSVVNYWNNGRLESSSYIDKTGKLVFGPFKEDSKPFNRGYAYQMDYSPKPNSYYIDRNGNKIVEAN